MLNYLKKKFEGFVKVINFNTTYSTETGAITEYADEVTELDAVVSGIQDAEDIQGTNTKGITEDTKDLKRTMAETVIQIAHKGLPLARKAKNKDLVKQLQREVSFIYRAAKLDALSRAREIQKALIVNSGTGHVLTNIKPADLTLVANDIKAYDDAHEDPDFAAQTKKFNGTAALLDLFNRGEAATENMYDYFYGYYQKTKPEIVKILADCLAMDREGVKHTGLIAMIVEANPPVGAITNAVENATLKIVELNYIATSDIYGLAGIAKIKPGTYHVEITKEGYVKKEMIIFFKRGRMEQVEVLMDRVPV